MGVICGVNPVLEALRARSREFDRLIIAKGARNQRVSEAIREATRLGIPLRFEIREALDRIAQGLNHQGVVAVVSVKALMDLESLIEATHDPALILALDGVEDPRNLGAILRVAEATRTDGVLLPDRHSVGLTETVSRSSAGALEHVRVARVGNLVQALERLKQRGIWIVGFDAAAKERWHDVDMARSVALVFGGEGRGIRRLVRDHCDFVVSLPMLGRIASLNVSVAVGVALYEAVRQRGWIPSHVRPIPPSSDTRVAESVIIGPGPDDVEDDPGRIDPTEASESDESMAFPEEVPAIRVLGLDDAVDWSSGEGSTRVIRKRRSGRQRWFERKRRRLRLTVNPGDQKPAHETPAASQPPPVSKRSRRRRQPRVNTAPSPSGVGFGAAPESALNGSNRQPDLRRATRRRSHRGRRRRRRPSGRAGAAQS
jgi:23S rRNA (guanosine2251-2'-O)-methyltransferase